uniref:Glycosyl transferase family 25 domain-containing protein n=1 Tax=viral metagenome TaxID=1070528 RepID=A0A6C0BCC3_9ZZZZ
MEFPPTLFINLEKRPDRRKRMEDAFVSWPVPIERVEAVENTPGWKGCTLSHRKCIELAAQRGYPWVLILEDDCLIKSSERFTSLLPTLWSKRDSFDVFLGGPLFFTRQTLIQADPPLINVNGKTTHFCLIPAHKYEQILRDIQPTYAVFVIDHYYARNFRIWATSPHLATQYESQSDIRKFENKSATIFKESEKALEDFLETGEVHMHIENFTVERLKDLDLA